MEQRTKRRDASEAAETGEMGRATANRQGEEAASAVCVASSVCLTDSEKGPLLMIEKKLKNAKQPSSPAKPWCGN